MGEQFRFTVNGREFFADAPVLDQAALNRIAGAARSPNSRLISVRASGNYVVADRVDVRRDAVLEDIPAATEKGGRRELYVKAQVASIAAVLGPRYGMPVQLDRALTTLFIPRYPLPRRWGGRETPLMIRIPAQYPDMPPIGFYLSKACSGPHIFSRNVYEPSEDFSAQGWNWYCIHKNIGWTPGST